MSIERTESNKNENLEDSNNGNEKSNDRTTNGSSNTGFSKFANFMTFLTRTDDFVRLLGDLNLEELKKELNGRKISELLETQRNFDLLAFENRKKGLEAEKSNMCQEINDLEDKLNRIKSELEKKEEELNTDSKLVDEGQREVGRSQDELNDMKIEKEKYEGELKKKNEEFETKEKEINDLQGELNKIEALIKGTENKKEKLKREVHKNKNVDIPRMEVTQLIDEMKSKEEELERKKAEIIEIRKNEECLKRSQKELQDRVEWFEENEKRFKKKLEDGVKQLSASEEEFQTKLKCHMEQLKKSEDHAEQLEKSEKKLRDKLATYNTKIIENQALIDELQQENQREKETVVLLYEINELEKLINLAKNKVKDNNLHSYLEILSETRDEIYFKMLSEILYKKLTKDELQAILEGQGKIEKLEKKLSILRRYNFNE